MNRVGYFSTAGGGDGAPVESRNQLVLGSITVGQAQSSSGINYSSAGIGGSFQPPSNTYNNSHFYTTAVTTDFPNATGISSINSHESSSREAKYITIVPGGSPLLTVASPIASAPTSMPLPQQQQSSSMHVGPMTSVRPTDTLTHSRLPHLSSLEVQYIGGSNQQNLQSIHNVPADAKFFNSMPDLFTYIEHPGDQQELDVGDEVYIDINNPAMSMNRASMLSNSSAISDFSKEPDVVLEVVNITDAERQRAEERKAKLAEAARLRYQKLSAEEKKEVNARRTAALQRKRQRQREIQELENLLRNSNDIQEDPVINEQLREKRIKARRAEAARLRYQRMTPEERKSYNYRRRLRQLGLDEKSQKEGIDPEMVRQHIIAQNARKAEAARLRYHRMSSEVKEEKKVYNRRRTASFKRRKIEEELLLSTPAGQISTEALQKAQQIMIRNAKRAEMARLRYQRMTPEQRRDYNARRAQAKKERSVSISSNTPRPDDQMEHEDGAHNESKSMVDEDALTILEREVIKRTKQAQAALMKQRQRQQVLETTTLQRPPTLMEQQQQIQQHTPRNVGKKRRQDTSQPLVATMETVQIEDPNAQRTLFYSHEGELIEFKQETSQPTIYIQGPQSSIEESIRQIVIQANQLPPGQQPQHILVEIPAEASQGAPIQTIYQIRTSQAPSAHHQAQSHHQLAQFSPDQPVGVVLAHQQQVDQMGKPHYQQHFYTSVEEGSIVVEDGQVTSTDQQTSGARLLSQQQQVLYQPSGSYHPDESCSIPELITPEQKLEAQRAKRAARARERYRRMSEDERKKFNAKRALALRKARSRDDELCRLADVAAETGEPLDEETIKAIKDAQLRRAKRAESARLKYQRMSSEERRQYNAMRDAQRRQRKREQEEGTKQQPSQRPMLARYVVESSMDQESHMLVNAPTQMEIQMGQDVSEQTTRGGEPVTIMYSTYDMDQPWAP